MAPLATAAQLASRLQQTLTAPFDVDAVTHASGLIRAIGAQQYSFVAQETVDLRGGERVLTLPQRPPIVDGANPLTVVELGDFGAADLTLTADRDYTRLGSELTRGYPPWWAGTQRLMGYPRGRPLGVWAPRVRVTYSHGYATVPDDIVSVTLDVAAALYTNPTGLRSVSIDDYTETTAAEVLGAAMVESIRVKLGVAGRRRRAFSIRA